MDTDLSPEWAQPSTLKHLPPRQILREGLIPNMDLQLQLAKRKRLSRVGVRLEEGRKCIKLPSLNIDLEDINMGVA